jgi:hypothetical protein
MKYVLVGWILGIRDKNAQLTFLTINNAIVSIHSYANTSQNYFPTTGRLQNASNVWFIHYLWLVMWLDHSTEFKHFKLCDFYVRLGEIEQICLYGFLLSVTNGAYFYVLEGLGRIKNRTVGCVMFDVLFYEKLWESRSKIGIYIHFN